MEIVFAAIITGLFGLIYARMGQAKRAADTARDLAAVVRLENSEQHGVGQEILQELTNTVNSTRVSVLEVKDDVRKVVGRVDRLERLSPAAGD